MFVTPKRKYLWSQSVNEWTPVGHMTQRDLPNTIGETHACDSCQAIGQAHPAILLPLPTPSPSTADLKQDDKNIRLEHIRLGLLPCTPSIPLYNTLDHSHKNKALKGISCFTGQRQPTGKFNYCTDRKKKDSLNQSKLSKEF